MHRILYLLFTEGYLATHAEAAIRRELCDEAIRLATILAEHPAGDTPETFALLALMHLHSARASGRQDSSGGLLLLEEQDRTLWDAQQIQVGLEWLARSAQGDVFSRYHAEAGIAAEHCLAPSFEATRWERVVECYALLERIPRPPRSIGSTARSPSPSGEGPPKGSPPSKASSRRPGLPARMHGRRCSRIWTGAVGTRSRPPATEIRRWPRRRAKR